MGKTKRCSNENCTIDVTGTCLLLKTDPRTCENYISEGADEELEEKETSSSLVLSEDSSIASTSSARRFHSGLELGIQDAVQIMRTRYTYLIGVLGLFDSGKTCFMSSLYFLASKGELLPRYTFAGSLTLQGFEDRIRRLRKWRTGSLPDKLADHTRLEDDRSPAFLHITLQQKDKEQQLLELLMTDLPGEWSKELIERADTAYRLNILNRADGIVIVIEGSKLASPGTKYLEVQKTKILLERLVQDVKVDPSIPLVLVASKCDLLNSQELTGLQELQIHAKELGFQAEVMKAVAFSSKPDEFPTGSGVLETMEIIVKNKPRRKVVDLDQEGPESSRVFQRFQE